MQSAKNITSECSLSLRLWHLMPKLFRESSKTDAKYNIHVLFALDHQINLMKFEIEKVPNRSRKLLESKLAVDGFPGTMMLGPP